MAFGTGDAFLHVLPSTNHPNLHWSQTYNTCHSPALMLMLFPLPPPTPLPPTWASSFLPPPTRTAPPTRLLLSYLGDRRQGMRVGNTFSRALDPTKPLLFGDFPLEILEEEVWHPSAGRLAWQDPVTGLTSDLSPEQTSATASAKPAADFSTDGPTSGKLATPPPPPPPRCARSLHLWVYMNSECGALA